MGEAQSINAGLSTLSRVIEALAKKRQSIPFRDNALTWILKDSLAGNTKTTLIITCTPHQFNKEETISTCRFASRCKLIKTHVSENTELKDRLDMVNDNGDENNNYNHKISDLRDEIEKLKSQQPETKEDGFEEERQELTEKIE